MKSFMLLCILGVASTTGGSIDTRDSQSSEKKVDFINNGVVNTFVGLPAVTGKIEQRVESMLEKSDARNNYVTLAFVNVSWYDGEKQHSRGDLQERSKYGMGAVLDIYGRLVHITDAYDPTDHLACNSSIRDSLGQPLYLIDTPWIALIKRGGCDFEKKILHVYREHAIGAIIYNNISGFDLNYMKITDKELLGSNITSIFTTMTKGDELVKLINKYNEVFVSITAGTRLDKTISMNHRSSVLFVTISFIVVMVISMLWLVVYYYQRFRYLQTKENEQKMDSNKAKEALKKIPTKTVRTLSKELESDCCAVCIEGYRINDILRSLPCKHEFHKNCIDPWLLEHHTCPLCKSRVLKQYGYVNCGSQESIIQLELDDDDESDVSAMGQQQRRYSVSPMPQIRSSESQNSVRSSDSDVDGAKENNVDPHQNGILVQKINVCKRCHVSDKLSEELSGSASLPARFNNATQCDFCCSALPDHQTLDVSKIKIYSKRIRPTILNLSNCDNNTEDLNHSSVPKRSQQH